MTTDKSQFSPLKVFLVYFLALFLVFFHEWSRIADWAEEVCLEKRCTPETLAHCAWAREAAARIGLAGLVRAENLFLGSSENYPVVGSIRGKSSSPKSVTTGPEKTIPPADPSVKAASALETIGNPGSTPSAPGSGARPVSPDSPESLSASPVSAGPLPSINRPLDLLHTPGQSPASVSAGLPSVGPVRPEGMALPDNPPAKPARITPHKILIAGDSMILEGFGASLERALKKYPGLSVVREGKYSSGLSRPDYFDWPAELEKLLKEHHPDLLIVSLGANDPQDILDEEHKRHFVTTDGWNKIYGERAARFLKIATDQKIFVVWVGLPIMGQEKYGKRIAVINSIVAEQCQNNPNCTFVDVWLTLADQKDQYTTFMTTGKGRHVRIRAKDKIHLTEAGGNIMVKDFLSRIENTIELPALEPPAPPTQAAPPTTPGPKKSSEG